MSQILKILRDQDSASSVQLEDHEPGALWICRHGGTNNRIYKRDAWRAEHHAEIQQVFLSWLCAGFHSHDSWLSFRCAKDMNRTF